MVLRILLGWALVSLALAEGPLGLTLIQKASGADGLSELEQTFGFARMPELATSVPFDIQQLGSDLRAALEPQDGSSFVRLPPDQIQIFRSRIQDMIGMRLSLLASQLSAPSQGAAAYRSSSFVDVSKDLTWLMGLSEFVSTRDDTLEQRIRGSIELPGSVERRTAIASMIPFALLGALMGPVIGVEDRQLAASLGITLIPILAVLGKVFPIFKNVMPAYFDFFRRIFYRYGYPGEIRRDVMPAWVGAFESHLGRALTSRERKKLNSIFSETVHEVRETMISNFCSTVLERVEPRGSVRTLTDEAEIPGAEIPVDTMNSTTQNEDNRRQRSRR